MRIGFFSGMLVRPRLLLAAMLVINLIHGSIARAAADRLSMMQLTSEHWLATQSEDGTLPYGFELLANRSTAPPRRDAVNEVREVLAIYAWAQYRAYSGDRRIERGIQRALDATGQRSLPIGKSRIQHWLEHARILSLPVARWRLQLLLGRLGLLYHPVGAARVVSPNGTYASAVANATAIALLAELAYSRASGDHQFAGLRSAWLDGLLTLRIPGRGFRQTPDTIEEDDYANGEAWLAIAAYCEQYGADSRCSIVSDLDKTLMARYSRTPSALFYHWGSMAAAQRFKTTRDARYLDFIQQQTTFFLGRTISAEIADANRCAPMEGVAAALAALESGGAQYAVLIRRMRAWLAAEADKLPKLQIQKAQDRVVLGGGAVLIAPQLATFSGDFMLGLYTPSVQIDATAHCMGAMIAIERDRLLTPSDRL